MNKPEYLESELTGKIISCAMEVHRNMGNGFQEKIYQRCLEIELNQRGFTCKREIQLRLYYKGIFVGMRRFDFLVEDRIMVELKAVIKLENAHLAQAINYLESSNLKIGLLINFGAKRLEFKRVMKPNK
ncbi:MAG: GxxExxY protein [Saprospiraceae bacterium]|nr:GxxExxY protein [Saprospiraceae bacterium]